MAAAYRLEYFGGFRVVESNGKIATRFRSRQAGALLAFLASHAGRAHSRDYLCEILWPDTAVDKARPRLSLALHSLRAQFEPSDEPGTLLVATPATIGINAPNVETDIDEFLYALRPEASSDEVQHGLAVWQPSLATGYYEDWIVEKQEHLNALWTARSVQIAYAALEAGDDQKAVSIAREVRSHFPEDDDVAALASVLALDENQGGAGGVRQNASSGNALETPAPAIRRRGRPRKEANGDPPVVEAVDWMSALALPNTAYFGREIEERLIQDAIDASETTPSIVTLVGAGGAGKTRLVREVLNRLMRDRVAVRAVDLTSHSEPDRLPFLIAEAIGAKPDEIATVAGAVPMDTETASTPYVQVLQSTLDSLRETSPAGTRHVLLLDNFEHFADRRAAWLDSLCSQIDGVTFVVTSRLKLLIPHEAVITVGALPLPPPSITLNSKRYSKRSEMNLPELMASPSIALFVDRARRSLPHFRFSHTNAEAVSALVRHLEGLPLAIELAAARVSQFRPEEILRRIMETARYDFLQFGRDAKSNKASSLSATLTWSMNLLPPELRRILARLASFRGGWSLDAARQVSGSSFVLDDLAQLLDSSLIVTVMLRGVDGMAARYYMLETVREYASAELLDAAGRAAADTAHGEFFANWCPPPAKALQGVDQPLWIERYRIESENIYAAIDRALKEETPEAARRALILTTRMHRFWMIQGAMTQGRRFLGDALERRRMLQPAAPELLIAATAATAVLASEQNDIAAARKCFRQALWLTRRYDSDNKTQIAGLKNNMGIVASQAGDLDDARRWCEESLELCREIGNKRLEGAAVANLAVIISKQGDFKTAERLFRQRIEIARQVDDKRGEAMGLYSLSEVSYLTGRISEAESFLRECLPLFQMLGDVVGIAFALLEFAVIAQHERFIDMAFRIQIIAESALYEHQVPPTEFFGAVYPIVGLRMLTMDERRHIDSEELFELATQVVSDPPLI